MERVEVLRGPAALSAGISSPSGVVNLIRKRPTEEQLRLLRLSIGSYDFKHAHIDLGGPIAETDFGDFGYRLNLAAEDSDSFRDRIFNKRKIASLALGWEFADRGSFTLLGDYIDNETPFDDGIFAIGRRPANVPRETTIDLPWGQNNYDSLNLGYDFEYKLTDSWAIRNLFNYQDFSRETIRFNRSNINDATGAVRLAEAHEYTERDSYSFFVDALNDGAIFGFRNRFVAGFQYGYNDGETFANLNAPFYNTNIFAPVIPAQIPVALRARPTISDIIYRGYYIEDIFGVLPSVDLIAGIRYDSYAEQGLLATANASTDNTNDAWSPRVGIVYRPAEPVSLYLSYARGFSPNPIVNQGRNIGAILPPERSTNYEAGIKTEFFDGRVAANTAVFRLVRTNRTFFDSVQNFTFTTGEQVHSGVELEAIGEVAPGLSVIGSYVYLTTEVVSRESANQGKFASSAPRHNAKLWTKYDFSGGALKGLSLAGGVYAESERFGDAANSYQHAGYARVDVGASYLLRLGRVPTTFRLNVENLFDKTYTFGNIRNQAYYGLPRSAIFSAEFSF